MELLCDESTIWTVVSRFSGRNTSTSLTGLFKSCAQQNAVAQKNNITLCLNDKIILTIYNENCKKNNVGIKSMAENTANSAFVAITVS